MKVILLLSIIVLSACLISTSQAQENNILKNGDFESSLGGSWTFRFPPGGAEAGDCSFELSPDGRAGSQAGKLSGTTPVRFAAVQSPKGFSPVPGTHYRISAWVRASEDFQAQPGTPGFVMRVSIFADLGTIDAERGLFYVGLDHKTARSSDTSLFSGQEIPKEWTKIEGVFDMSADAASINVCLFMWNATGSVYVDDVALEEVDASTPLSP